MSVAGCVVTLLRRPGPLDVSIAVARLPPRFGVLHLGVLHLRVLHLGLAIGTVLGWAPIVWPWLR